MNSFEKWEQYYKETSLEKIPWQRTQADYFTEVIDSGKFKTGSALDLGCGTGMKSIYLARKGFKVFGVDISEAAIKIAENNALEAGLKVKFTVADATNLGFLKDKKFDFILDWANFHGIPKNKRLNYINGIINHIKKGGKLLLRCFEKGEDSKESVLLEMGRIYFFSKKDIKKFFGKNFRILETNRSKPFVRAERKPPAEYLGEYLMEKL
jgi:2-polyprenyl-3-methyl-5-hydroxy-6-metoxy-1,4-benzoquinol methylase